MEQHKAIHRPEVKEIIKTAEEKVISATQQALGIIKRTLSREVAKAFGHEAVEVKKVNYSSNELEIKPLSKQIPLISNGEILNVDQNLSVDLGERRF